MSRICPICYRYSDFYDMFCCENFDNSLLYENVYLYKCKGCGHIYNDLSKEDLNNLKKYYEEEYALFDLEALDKCGFRPGSNNPLSIKRYELLYEFISPYITKDSRILDIGCALGGLLDFLKGKGYKNLYGIDINKDYVNLANGNVKTGDVYNIPFEDNFFDIVIVDHTLEHLANLELAMKEIRRVLDRGGLCYIGVPDAEKYDNDIYWFTMREHIQHFNIIGLKLLAQLNNFELINYKKTDIDMIGTSKLPNLSVLLKISSKVYCWGIGREFMYYYPNTRLKDLELILVDDTPSKQKLTFKGMKIHSSDILKKADKNTFLIITPSLHKKAMREKALKIGYKGEIIDI